MFRNFYEYYQWVLSRFNPVYASEIRRLLNIALDFYNDKNYQSFIIIDLNKTITIKRYPTPTIFYNNVTKGCGILRRNRKNRRSQNNTELGNHVPT